MSQLPEIKHEELNKLVKFIDFFQRLDATTSENEKRNMLACEEIREFHDELWNTGFLIVFDWKNWLHENETYQHIANDIEEHIMKADIATLRKLMTSYIRGDRFTEGLFEGVIINGHVTKILTRLRELMEMEGNRRDTNEY
ncbi:MULTISPECIES: DUF6508 domain-containing protein [unclassified Lysinibacillus]|uniref:DUF6508 domain-containing protein n=1 Tax=unclassified Lysinibacillus TaxID=2636778 RepID=UPI0038133256